HRRELPLSQWVDRAARRSLQPLALGGNGARRERRAARLAAAGALGDPRAGGEGARRVFIVESGLTMPRYRAEAPFAHDRPPRLGVLLINLGTPDAPTPAAVRRYLAEFLSDPRVVEIPSLAWRPILHGVVLRLRPARSADRYANIWTKDGSPLMVHSQRQRTL